MPACDGIRTEQMDTTHAPGDVLNIPKRCLVNIMFDLRGILWVDLGDVDPWL